MRVSAALGLLVVGFAAVKLWQSVQVLEPLADGNFTQADTNRDDGKGVETIINRLIKENPIIVFSKSYCGFSRQAKGILERHLGAGGFTVVELDQRPDGSEIQDYMLELTGARTVPRVFIDGVFIGGADGTAHADSSGRLAALLKGKSRL